MKYLMHSAAAIALAASASTANAADFVEAAPAAPDVVSYSWAGGYVGIHGGYGWGDIEARDTSLGLSLFAGFNPTFEATVAILFNDADTFDAEGGLAGVHAGYNVQLGHFVFGLENDFDWSGIDGEGRLLFPGGGQINGSVDLDWLATSRGRVGFAFERYLVYATGGVAIGRIEAFTDLSTPVLPGVSFAFEPDGQTHVGWTAGAGVEAMLTPNLSARLEYAYTEFDTDTFESSFNPGPRQAVTVERDYALDVHAVKVGLSYRFDTGRLLGN